MNTPLVDATTQLHDTLLPGSSKKDFAKMCADLDTLLINELIAQGYYTESTELSDAVLKKHEARNAKYALETVYDKLNKLRAIQNNITPQKAVPHWLGNAQRTMLRFLERYAVGYLDQMYIDKHGIIHITIECRAGDNNDGRWELQQETLKSVGINLEKNETSFDYYIPATSNNVSNITGLFANNRPHVDVNLNVRYGAIETIMLELNAEEIETFETAPIVTAAPETTKVHSEQLAEMETKLLKNEIKSFQRAACHLYTANADRLLACQNLEISFCLICGALNADAKIKSIVDKRYHDEQATAKECHAVSEAIGKAFNPKDVRESVVRMVQNMEQYLYEQIGMDIKEVEIAPANEGTVRAQLKYTIPHNPRKHPNTPRPQNDTTQWDIHLGTGYLLSTERNHKKILDFCRAHGIHLIDTQSEYNRTAQDFIIKTVDISQTL